MISDDAITSTVNLELILCHHEASVVEIKRGTVTIIIYSSLRKMVFYLKHIARYKHVRCSVWRVKCFFSLTPPLCTLNIFIISWTLQHTSSVLVYASCALPDTPSVLWFNRLFSVQTAVLFTLPCFVVIPFKARDSQYPDKPWFLLSRSIIVILWLSAVILSLLSKLYISEVCNHNIWSWYEEAELWLIFPIIF